MVPEGWKTKRIDEIAIINVGRDLVEDAHSPNETFNHVYPIYSNTVDNRGLYGFYNFPEYTGDYVSVVGRGIGLGTAFARRNEQFGAIGRLLLLSPKDNSFDVKFFAEYINNRLRIFNESSGIPQLPGSAIAKYRVILPPIKEQEKIAEILSTWDQAIETTEKLIANSERQKKALMQQLFTVKKRLPGFSGEWESKKLSKLFRFKKGKGLSKSKVIEDGDYECLLYGELYTHYSDMVRDVKSRTNHHEGVPSKAGDVLIPASTTTSGIDLANATAVMKDGILLSGDINILRPKNSNVAPRFIARLLTHIEKFKLARKAQGITIIHLYGRHLKDITINVPSIEEQVAISNIIDEADADIEKLKSKLEHLRQEKSALMQQLLTGKRRVKIDEEIAA